MTAAAGIAAIAIFLIALERSGLVAHCGRAVERARTAAAGMRDPALDDAAKERHMRQASLALFGAFAQILLRGLAVCLLAFAPILLADLLGLAEQGRVLAWLARLDVIIIGSLVVVAALLLLHRPWLTK